MWRAAKQLPATSFAARRIELNVWCRKDLNRPPMPWVVFFTRNVLCEFVWFRGSYVPQKKHDPQSKNRINHALCPSSTLKLHRSVRRSKSSTLNFIKTTQVSEYAGGEGRFTPA